MKNKAIFLDRDGVINIERGEYTYLEKDFIFADGIFTAMKILQNKGYLLFVITNQSGIAKGIYTEEQMNNLHEILLKKCNENYITITEIYYCPHHPTKSNCICRKPDSLLIEKAIARFNIDADNSYFIGDKERDAYAGIKAGLRPISIQANENLNSYIYLIK